MKGIASKLSLYAFAAVFSAQGHAHGRWVVPSHTVLSGETPEYVTFDISISNDIFYPDYAIGGYPEEKITDENAAPRKVPPPIKIILDSTRLQITKPDGSVKSDYTMVDFHRKSVASALLDQDGSYRVSLEQNPIYFTWFKKADDSLGRLYGKAESVKAMLPDGAKDIRTTKLFNTVETYITRNNGSNKALSITGEGLELKYASHVNELFVGESLSFTVMFNGKVLSEGVEAHIVRNDTRYRNDRETIELKSDKKGQMKVQWQKPGLYLLEMEYERTSKEPGVETETFANYVVFEVFPE